MHYLMKGDTVVKRYFDMPFVRTFAFVCSVSYLPVQNSGFEKCISYLGHYFFLHVNCGSTKTHCWNDLSCQMIAKGSTMNSTESDKTNMKRLCYNSFIIVDLHQCHPSNSTTPTPLLVLQCTTLPTLLLHF